MIAALWMVIGILFLFTTGLAWWCSRLYQFHIDNLLFRHMTNRVIGELQSSLNKVEGAIGMRDGEVVRAITENLDAEMEKSANLTEMRRAKRTTLPRIDAGPPAKVSKLKINRK